ncbi:MAG: hypothetical protein K0Q52_172 [Microbacterium sp.]|nr:hypothetical protein [Microbacterium sp.]
MNIFSSRTPRDLNRDPAPWVWLEHGERRGRTGGELQLPQADGWKSRYEPRPEYEHVQHNEPNPILVDVRKFRALRLKMNNPKGWAYILRVVERAVTARAYADVTVTEEHIDHARRVLTRLARLAEGVPA